jgi:hypothetical protein
MVHSIILVITELPTNTKELNSYVQNSDYELTTRRR